MGGMPPPRGAADAAGVAAGKPPPREDVAAADGLGAAPDENMGRMTPPRGAADAAGVAVGKPSPREDVASANGVGAALDENMGGMPPPRGAADAAGVGAGKPPPREDVAAANGSGAAPGEDAVDDHGLEEVIAPPPQVGTSPWKAWRWYPKGIPVNLIPICLGASYKVLMFAGPRELWKSLTSMLDGAPGRIIAATIAGG